MHLSLQYPILILDLVSYHHTCRRERFPWLIQSCSIPMVKITFIFFQQEVFLFPSSTKPVEVEESSQWADLAENSTLGCNASLILMKYLRFTEL